MGDIVNLRRVRKAAQREAASRQADANRLKSGRSKAERAAQALQSQKAGRDLDQHRLGVTPGRDAEGTQ